MTRPDTPPSQVRSVLGTAQTAAYVCFVVVLSTVAGLLYGGLF